MKPIFDGFLLVTDLDGTLLNTQSKISEGNKKAIEYFVAHGGHFTIATGRIVNSAYPFAKVLPLTLPAILYNGGRIYDYKKQTTLEESYLREDIKTMIRDVKKDNPQLGIQLFIEHDIYIFTPSEEDSYLSEKGYTVHHEVSEETFKKSWTKILMMGQDEEEVDALEKRFCKLYGEAEIMRSGSRYLEIVADGVSKGEKLKKLITTYGIDPAKVIAVGDNMNDAHMLQVAAYGFAIANGSQRLVDTAQFIAPENDKDAIAYIVKYIENIA